MSLFKIQRQFQTAALQASDTGKAHWDAASSTFSVTVDGDSALFGRVAVGTVVYIGTGNAAVSSISGTGIRSFVLDAAITAPAVGTDAAIVFGVEDAAGSAFGDRWARSGVLPTLRNYTGALVPASGWTVYDAAPDGFASGSDGSLSGVPAIPPHDSIQGFIARAYVGDSEKDRAYIQWGGTSRHREPEFALKFDAEGERYCFVALRGSKLFLEAGSVDLPADAVVEIWTNVAKGATGEAGSRVVLQPGQVVGADVAEGAISARHLGSDIADALPDGSVVHSKLADQAVHDENVLTIQAPKIVGGLLDEKVIPTSVARRTEIPSSTRLVPPGGSTGQVLKKDSATNYDVSWQNDETGSGSGSGSGTGGLSRVVSNSTLTGDGTAASPLEVSNPFTDAHESKLDAIEPRATADQTASEIKAAYESNADTNALTDSEKTKLAGIDSRLVPDGGSTGQVLKKDSASDYDVSWQDDEQGSGGGGGLSSVSTDATITGTGASGSPLGVANPFTAADETKLDGIEDNATADQTAAEIKTAYESNPDTNAFTDAERTKLEGIAAGAEANVGVEFTSTEKTKLAGIDSRLLPSLPAPGSRDNKVPKFDGDTLGWEEDAAGGGSATVADGSITEAKLASGVADKLHTDAEIDSRADARIAPAARAGSADRWDLAKMPLEVLEETPAARIRILPLSFKSTGDITAGDITLVMDDINTEFVTSDVDGIRLTAEGEVVHTQAWSITDSQQIRFSISASEASAIGAFARNHIEWLLEFQDNGVTVAGGYSDRHITPFGTSPEFPADRRELAAIRQLPEFPAEGSRDNKVPKFDGDTLGWEADEVGSLGGGLSTVSSDATLTGDGTSGDPLKVANPFEAADETKLDGITYPVPTAGIVDNAVTQAKIAEDAVGGREIGAGEIATGHIADDAVTGPKIPANAIQNNHIAANAVSGGEIQGGAVDTPELADDAVTQAKLAAAVRTRLDGFLNQTQVDARAAVRYTDDEKTKLGGIPAFPAAGSRTGKIAKFSGDTLAWTDDDLADGSVTTPKLADDAVTQDKLAEDSVGGRELKADSVATGHIADDAVTGPKIPGNTITTSHIGADAVGNSELAANAVNTAEIADGAVTDPKLATATRSRLVPAAGTDGQILAKSADADYQTEWIDAPSGGDGSVGQTVHVFTADGFAIINDAENTVQTLTITPRSATSVINIAGHVDTNVSPGSGTARDLGMEIRLYRDTTLLITRHKEQTTDPNHDIHLSLDAEWVDQPNTTNEVTYTLRVRRRGTAASWGVTDRQLIATEDGVGPRGQKGDPGDGLASVSSNATLTGDGTTGSPLGVADDSIGPAQLDADTAAKKTAIRAEIGAGTSTFDGAYNSLTGRPTIPPAVPENRRFPPGGTTGQVLKKTSAADFADNVTWADDAGLTAVATDATITGDGTTGSPLVVANPFTAADETKLDGIEDSATADMTGAEIVAAIPDGGLASGKIATLDASKLTGTIDDARIPAGIARDAELPEADELIPSGGTAGQVLKKDSATDHDVSWGDDAGLTAVATDATLTGDGTTSDTLKVANPYTAAEKTKLGGIEAGATADQTAAEIKTAYESNPNTNAFTDAERTRLDRLPSKDVVAVPAVATGMSFRIAGEAGVAGLPNTVGGDYQFDYREASGRVFVVNRTGSADFNVSLADLLSIAAVGAVDQVQGTVFYIVNYRANGNITFSGGGIANIRPTPDEGDAVVRPGYAAFVLLSSDPFVGGEYLLSVNSWNLEGAIEDGSVTTAGLADGSVTAPKLADNAVVGRTINAGAVSEAKLSVALRNMLRTDAEANALADTRVRALVEDAAEVGNAQRWLPAKLGSGDPDAATVLHGDGTWKDAGRRRLVEVPTATAQRISFRIAGQGDGETALEVAPNGIQSTSGDYQMDYRNLNGKVFAVDRAGLLDFSIDAIDTEHIPSRDAIGGTLFYVVNERTEGDIVFTGDSNVDIRPTSGEGGAEIKPGYAAAVHFNPHDTDRWLMSVSVWNQSGEIAAGSVTTDKLATGAVTTAKLADFSVTNDKLGGISGSKITSGIIDGARFPPSVVRYTDATPSLVTSQIRDAAITAPKLAADAVTQAKIADGAVGTPQIADASVTAAKLSGDAVEDAIGGSASAADRADKDIRFNSAGDGFVLADPPAAEPAPLFETVVTGGSGAGLRAGTTPIPVGDLTAVHQTAGTESSTGATDYFTIATDGLSVTATTAGTISLNAEFDGNEINNSSGTRAIITVVLTRTRNGATKDFVLDSRYTRGQVGGGTGAHRRWSVSAETKVVAQANDRFAFRLQARGDAAASPDLVSGRMTYTWLSGIAGEDGSDGSNVRVIRAVGTTGLASPVVIQPGSITSVVRVVLTYEERHQSVRPVEPQAISITRTSNGVTTTLKSRQVTVATPGTGYVPAPALMAVDVPATTGDVSYDIATLHSQTTGDVRDYRNFELVVMDYGAAAQVPVQQSSSSVPFSRQQTFFFYQTDTTTTAPAFDDVTWASGNFYNVPTGWRTEPLATPPADTALWIGIATAASDGTVEAAVTRVVDGWNVRWYEANSLVAANSPTFTEGTHTFYRLRQTDGTWGPLLPIEAPNQLGWTTIFQHNATFGTQTTVDIVGDNVINFDDWAEVAVQIDNHGLPANGIHQRQVTHPIPTNIIGPLAAHDATTGNRGNVLRVSVGGASRAGSLAVVSWDASANNWDRFDGIDLCVMLRRVALNPEDRVGSMYFFPRAGGFNEAANDMITFTLLAR